MLRKIACLFISYFALSSCAFAEEDSNYETHRLRKPDAGLHLRALLGADISMFQGTNRDIDGGLGFGGGVGVEWYFSRYLGLYGTLFFSRLEFDDEDTTPIHLGSLPLGVTTQFHLFNSDIVNSVGLGVMYSRPLSGMSSNFGELYSFHMQVAGYYRWTETFDFGASVEVFAPFSVLSTPTDPGPWVVGYRAGISSRLRL